MNDKKEYKCPLCAGLMINGETEIIFRRQRNVVVVEKIPALVCQHCGEATINSVISQQVYELADKEIKRGVTLEFCNFRVA